MATPSRTLFPSVLIPEVLSAVKGKSSLAKLSSSQPIPFNGIEQFIFSMDNEVDIVAENGAKSHGGISFEPVKIVPIKFEYGSRVPEEFLYAADEEKIEFMRAYVDGFAKKIAKGLDLAAMHGINPRTNSASAVVGSNHFDAAVTATVAAGSNPDYDALIETATGMVEAADMDVTGLAADSSVRQGLAAKKTTAGERLYPELAWGGAPGTLNGLPVDFNRTVGAKNVDAAIVGDFENCFKWGYSKEIPMKVIEYGDPDNTGVDLQGHNQVYIRSEIFIGWGIIAPSAFVRITK